MTTHALFYSSDDDFKEDARLSLYTYKTSLCELEDLLLVCQPLSAMETGSWPPNGVTAPILTTQSCWSAQYEGASSASQWPVFYEVHKEVLLPPLVGSEPPAMLALVPVCCSANPLALASRWATSLRLSDSAVCREGFSRRHGNWFILLPITHLFKVFDWSGLPRRRQSKGLWDEKWPRRERQSEYGNFTADRKSCCIFHENRKLFLYSPKLSVSPLCRLLFQSFTLCFLDV